VTEYQARVEQVLKGPALANVVVTVVGGHVSFPEGTTAIITSSMPAPVHGERYVFFLVPSEYQIVDDGPDAGVHARAWAPQHLSLGVFLLGPSGVVRPRARADHPLAKAFTGMSHADFLAAIERLASKRRKPS